MCVCPDGVRLPRYVAANRRQESRLQARTPGRLLAARAQGRATRASTSLPRYTTPSSLSGLVLFFVFLRYFREWFFVELVFLTVLPLLTDQC